MRDYREMLIRNILLAKIDRGFIHLVGAFMAIPGYLFLGPYFKLLITPYVLYLVLSRKAQFLPALLVHFLLGTIISPIILAASVFASFISVGRLRALGLLPLFSVSAALLPIMTFVGIQKMTVGGYDLIETASQLSLFLGIFTFFYGAVIATTFRKEDLHRVFFVLLFAAALQASGTLDYVVRYFALSVAFYLTIAICYPLLAHKLHFSRTLLLSSLILSLLVISGALPVSFALVLSTLLATILVLTYSHRTLGILGRQFGIAALIMFFIVSVYITVNVESYMGNEYEVAGIAEIQSVEDTVPALAFKAFGDRGVLWRGTWEVLVSNANLWPPLHMPSTWILKVGGKFDEREYGAHNLGLELIRQYGFVVGIIVLLIFFTMIGKCAGVFRLRNLPVSVVTLASAVVAIGFINAVVGQFVLMGNFSLLLLGIAGVLYALAEYQRAPTITLQGEDNRRNWGAIGQ